MYNKIETLPPIFKFCQLQKVRGNIHFIHSNRNIYVFASVHYMDNIVEPTMKPFADYLMNPANQGLVGTKLSYFPQGGILNRHPPFITNTKEWESSTNWKGMESGSNMRYPIQCIDGLVHRECGIELREYLENTYASVETVEHGDALRCATGEVVYSPSFARLIDAYPKGIIHCVAPYYLQKDLDWSQTLFDCYLKAWNLILELNKEHQNNSSTSVAVPFIGTGIKSIPLDKGLKIAANAFREFKQAHHKMNDDSSSSFMIQFVTNKKDDKFHASMRRAFELYDK